ncbi:hypothetical protein FHP29_15255 [Nocardioides albidus]|uniref:Uncharacterized protein n=1 Tax=Nocardioides albidus TaxID=1517589 RepID=A0A5C4VRX4_9ACTN|nr:hypothetical protein [Nocardioides albidus]TNM38587.1 hypothetical protein FHP29_15255 [Nocardioides albidus]
MTESAAAYLLPPPPSPRGSSMVLRHLASVVLALGLTPVGVLVLDYGAGKYYEERIRNFSNAGTTDELLLILLGGVILMGVAACGRLSGLGPVLAGLLWGLVPFVWFLADIEGFFELSQDLPSTYLWFRSPSSMFPLVAAMLVGAGLAGRWRGRRHRAQ